MGFLPVFILLYYLTPVKYRNITLFVGSIFFYAYGEPFYVFLLLGSIGVNYTVGRSLTIDKQIKPLRRKVLFWGMAAVDVLLLLAFKWLPGADFMPVVLGMPLGVSFYTFRILSYLTDVYRGEIAAEKSLLKFSIYVSMFPQVVAGPIVNYSEVAADLKQRTYRLAFVDEGLKRFVCGLVIKVLLADRLGILWHEIATIGYESISTPFAWLGAFAYSMRIYFDFWGYSLMAVGLGRMLGFTLPENFDFPYMAKSVREFYRRWHMTLGRWFREYVYIPLGGSRKGTFRTIGNLFLVWILTALWHGGSLNFLLWGLSLFCLIVLERLFLGKRQSSRGGLLSHLYVLTVIPLTWMCFAIEDIGELFIYFGRLFGFVEGINVNEMDVAWALSDYGWILAVGVLCCTPLLKKLYLNIKDNFVGCFALAVLFWMCVNLILTEGYNPFLYLRF